MPNESRPRAPEPVRGASSSQPGHRAAPSHYLHNFPEGTMSATAMARRATPARRAHVIGATPK
jgi:hypothetical protein